MILRGKKILQKIQRSYFYSVEKKNYFVKEIGSFLVQISLILLALTKCRKLFLNFEFLKSPHEKTTKF